MVLPRLVWLSFLKRQKCEGLLKGLLPDYFDEKGVKTTVACPKKNMNLKDLCNKFDSTWLLLIDAQQAQGDRARARARSVAWEILIHRAVLGPGHENANAYDRLMSPLQEKSRNAVEDFIRQLESWS